MGIASYSKTSGGVPHQHHVLQGRVVGIVSVLDDVFHGSGASVVRDHFHMSMVSPPLLPFDIGGEHIADAGNVGIDNKQRTFDFSSVGIDVIIVGNDIPIYFIEGHSDGAGLADFNVLRGAIVEAQFNVNSGEHHRFAGRRIHPDRENGYRNQPVIPHNRRLADIDPFIREKLSALIVSLTEFPDIGIGGGIVFIFLMWIGIDSADSAVLRFEG